MPHFQQPYTHVLIHLPIEMIVITYDENYNKTSRPYILFDLPI